MSLEYRSPTDDELAAVLGATHVAFGEELKDDEVERQRRVMQLDRILAAWDDGRPVGVTASYPFELTVPGGSAKAGGVTYVGVLPSHRRRGILRELMQRQLEDLHRRGEPLAILWASESLIYGRFGYGIASPETGINAERSSFALRDDPGPRGTIRLVTAEEAAELFAPLYESRRLEQPGSLSRTRAWWTEILLADPEDWRRDRGLKYYALLEIDGEKAGYVLYRVKPKWEDDGPKGEVTVIELFATSPESTAELWRFLFGVDLIARVKAWRLDPAWPLFLMVTDPRRLHLSVTEGLWLRFVDLEAALSARRFNDAEEAVLEVDDALLPHNSGRFLIGHEPRRTDADADVALHVTDLASAYLGAFTFERLAAAGRARELRPGGLARATDLFSTPIPPHCPEGF